MRTDFHTTVPQSGSKPVLDLAKLPGDSWRPSGGADQRRTLRTTEREIEMIPARIRLDKESEWTQVRLWDYSPAGFGVLYLSNSGHARFNTTGILVDLRLGSGADAFDGAGELEIRCRLENTVRQEKGMRLGLSRLDISLTALSADNGLPDGYLRDTVMPLSARVRNPFLYNEWAQAKLVAIGPKASFVFESDDASLLMFKGLLTTIDLEVPLDTKAAFTGRIAWVATDAGGTTTFSIQDNDIPFALANAVGGHFVQAEICTPNRLSDFGIGLKRFKDQFRFRFVSTQEEYDRIIGLRRAAYAKAGKVHADAPIDPIAAEFDSRSRLLTAFHGDGLVASVVMSFGGADGAPMRSEGCFPGSRYPVPIPPKETVVEVHSLCTDSEYRGGDLIQGMFEHVARTVLFSDREWLLTFTTAELWPLYRRIGFRKTGASVAMVDMGGLEHHLILMHRDSLVAGLRMTPFAWNYFFGQMVRDLIAQGNLSLEPRLKARVAFYSLFAGIGGMWMNSGLERDFRVLMRETGKKAAEG